MDVIEFYLQPHKPYRPASNQHMILSSAILVVIVSVGFTKLLLPDVPYALTDAIISAQRRKTDDLSPQLKLRYCVFFFGFLMLAGLSSAFCSTLLSAVGCAETTAYSATLSGALFLLGEETFQVFLR